jgi:hypothetical protein
MREALGPPQDRREPSLRIERDAPALRILGVGEAHDEQRVFDDRFSPTT